MSKPIDLASVTLGFETYLLPAAAALKVVTLMKDALVCERHFSGRDKYVVSENRLRVEMSIVRPDEVVMPASTKQPPPARPRRLT